MSGGRRVGQEQGAEKASEILLGMVSHERREPGWAYRHGLRTANLSLWLRERLFPEEAGMDDILYTAALFHDCAKDDEADHGRGGRGACDGIPAGHR